MSTLLAVEPPSPPPSRPVLAWIARTLGLLCVLLATAGIVMSQMSWATCQKSVLLLLLTIPLGLAVVILGFIARSPFAYRSSGFAMCVAAAVLWFGYSLPPCGERINANDVSAVGSLRTIAAAQQQYASSNPLKGYATTLEQLGPAGADLIDNVLAGGEKNGYRFTLEPGPPDAQGRITAFSVPARPLQHGVSGFRNFFADQSGRIWQTQDDRPATVKDNPVN